MGIRRLALLALAASWAPNTGCSLSRPPSSAPAKEVRAPHAQAAPRSEPSPETEVPDGVFHRVEAGQTLWRIARAYGVAVDDLLSANGLTDPTALASGTMLFVPGAHALLSVPPYPAPPPTPAPVVSTALPGGAPAEEFVWPVAGGEILSLFGAPRRGRRHAGIDIRGPLGQEILATGSGEVVYCGAKFSGYGKMVILDHGHGLESVYAHASDLLVGIGDHVERGQAVARVGRSGNATTEHCHFELRENKVPIDPLPRYPELARALAGAPVETAASGPSRHQKRMPKPKKPENPPSSSDPNPAKSPPGESSAQE